MQLESDPCDTLETIGTIEEGVITLNEHSLFLWVALICPPKEPSFSPTIARMTWSLWPYVCVLFCLCVWDTGTLSLYTISLFVFLERRGAHLRMDWDSSTTVPSQPVFLFKCVTAHKKSWLSAAPKTQRFSALLIYASPFIINLRIISEVIQYKFRPWVGIFLPPWNSKISQLFLLL